MPCDTIRLYSVDFNASDIELLAKAATAIGGQYVTKDVRGKALTFWHSGSQVTVAGGKITVSEGREAIIDKLKGSYSKQVLKAAASRFRLDLKQDTKNENKLTLRWRY